MVEPGLKSVKYFCQCCLGFSKKFYDFRIFIKNLEYFCKNNAKLNLNRFWEVFRVKCFHLHKFGVKKYSNVEIGLNSNSP